MRILSFISVFLIGVQLLAQPFGPAGQLAYDIDPQDGWGRVLEVYDFDGNGFDDVVYGVKATNNTWFMVELASHFDYATWGGGGILDTLHPSTPADQYNYFNEAYFFFERVDADGDGDEDLLTFDSVNDSLRLVWFENVGTNLAIPAVPFLNFNDEIISAHLADVNHDGLRDLQVTLANGWMRANGLPAGGFGTMQSVPYTCPDFDIYFGDFNNDGLTDYAHNPNGNVYIYLGQGNGVFTWNGTSVALANDIFTGLNFHDLTGDNLPDMIYESGSDVYFLHNLGDGFYGDESDADTQPVIGEISVDEMVSEGHFFDAADIDNDGDMDVLGDGVFLNETGEVFYWYENDGTGEFVPHVIPTEVNPAMAAWSDLNNDGPEDIVLIGLEGGWLFQHGNWVLDGCTDPAACNYDSQAQNWDGTCCYGVCGCTYSWAVNYDPGATCNPGDCMVLQEGFVFHDANENGVWDSNEIPLAGAELHFYPTGISTITDNDGFFSVAVPLEVIQISCETNNVFPFVTTANNIDYSVNSNPDDIYFGVSEEFQIQQIETEVMVPVVGYPCDMLTNHYVVVHNPGNVPLNVAAWVEPDAMFTDFIPLTSMVDTLDGRYYFDTTYVSPGSVVSLPFRLRTPTADNVGANLTLDCGAVGWYTPELYSTDSSTTSTLLTCAYDPNDKAGFPDGWSDAHYVLAGDTIEYRIRFQNTGNAPATDVIVEDTLNLSLDANSFEWLGSSHPMTYAYYPEDRAMHFRFMGIQLPDSVNNEPESHGWIRYRMVVRTDAQHDELVENTAHIYFDNNEAVVTNTTDHRVFDCATFNPLLEYNNGVLETVSGMSYQWYYNGMPLAGAGESTLVPFGEGSYCVTVQHPLGCIANQLCESVTSVQEVSDWTIQLIRLEDGFRIESTEALEYCKVYDPLGKLIMQQTIQGMRTAAIHKQLDSGCYFIECMGVSNRTQVLKLLR
ncbi:MAG: FG-GAP-like repeat-containing protein [Flavobacteriales bacterium]|jgi:uncharacterized repeat protein (TIGR01451 family)